MIRICIIGSPGSGKSVLARRLAALAGAPLYHLDDLYWIGAWNRPTEEAWLAQLAAVAATDCWVIDGNYAPSLDIRLQRATHVILLDHHPARCVYGIVRRTVRLRLGMSDHVPLEVQRSGAPVVDRLVPLIRKAATFRRRIRPAVMARLDRLDPEVYVEVLTTRRDVESMLNRLCTRYAMTPMR